jgi:hypothetical protein
VSSAARSTARPPSPHHGADATAPRPSPRAQLWSARPEPHLGRRLHLHTNLIRHCDNAGSQYVSNAFSERLPEHEPHGSGDGNAAILTSRPEETETAPGFPGGIAIRVSVGPGPGISRISQSSTGSGGIALRTHPRAFEPETSAEPGRSAGARHVACPGLVDRGVSGDGGDVVGLLVAAVSSGTGRRGCCDGRSGAYVIRRAQAALGLSHAE